MPADVQQSQGSLSNTAIVLLCIPVLLAIAVILLPRLSGSSRSPALRDSTQMRGIHNAMHLFAMERDGWLPQPGQIRTDPDGREDVTQNTTAHLYSMMIALNYFSPEAVVSPLERNPAVQIKSDYDWDCYDPATSVFWDASFRADLERESHASYAHLLLHGHRVHRLWRESLQNTAPVLGNRGPRGGQPDPRSYTCDAHGRWEGTVIGRDNSVQTLQSMTPSNLTWGTPPQPDNLFAMEGGAEGEDVILTFTTAITEDGPVIQHD